MTMQNPMEIVRALKTKSPQEIILNQLVGNIDNPMVKCLITMAQKGQTKNVEAFARNLMKEQGKDFDKEFTNFMKDLNG